MQPKAEVAKVTAEVATRILDGEKPGEIKMPPLPLSPPKYDWRLVQRFGIAESNLPPGSTIHYQPPPIWESYRWQIVTIAAVILLQAALILWLLYERRRRCRLEAQARQRLAELAHMNRQPTAGHLSASIAHELNELTWRHPQQRRSRLR